MSGCFISSETIFATFYVKKCETYEASCTCIYLHLPVSQSFIFFAILSNTAGSNTVAAISPFSLPHTRRENGRFRSWTRVKSGRTKHVCEAEAFSLAWIFRQPQRSAHSKCNLWEQAHSGSIEGSTTTDARSWKVGPEGSKCVSLNRFG